MSVGWVKDICRKKDSFFHFWHIEIIHFESTIHIPLKTIKLFHYGRIKLFTWNVWFVRLRHTYPKHDEKKKLNSHQNLSVADKFKSVPYLVKLDRSANCKHRNKFRNLGVLERALTYLVDVELQRNIK